MLKTVVLLKMFVKTVTLEWKEKKLLPLFGKAAWNWSKVTVSMLVMFQKISVSNKCCLLNFLLFKEKL